MPNINWNQIEREEDAIDNDESLSVAEKSKLINQLNREAREEYEEQQREERERDFGW